MAVCENKNISSNSTSLNITEEECLGQLAETNTLVWQNVETNSYSDMGGENSTVARTPISTARQDKKGTVTDLTVGGGFNIDFTQNNCLTLLEAAFFAKFRKKLNLASTGVTATGFTVGADGTNFKEGNLLLSKGFDIQVNNGLKVVGTGSTATEVKVAGLSVDTSKGTIRLIGHRFAAGDLKIGLEGNVMVMTTTAGDFTTFGFNAGEWLFIGGDEDNAQFEQAGTGYARINRVTAKKITFDDSHLNHKVDAGAGKSIEIYFGDVLFNEATSDKIVRKSFTFERTLGKNLEYDNVQAEYISGAVLNEFKLNVPQGDKLNADVDFKATNYYTRSGNTNDKVLSSLGVGNKPLPALGEAAFNTTKNIRALRLNVIDNTTSSSKPLFAYLTEADITFTNNLSENKALGVLGAVDISAGNFQAMSNVTAYFSDTRVLNAIARNADVGIYMVFAQANAGFVFDIPLVTASGGKLQVEKDNPITTASELQGAENKHGYTAMYVDFAYLPTIAM